MKFLNSAEAPHFEIQKLYSRDANWGIFPMLIESMGLENGTGDAYTNLHICVCAHVQVLIGGSL